MRSCTTWVAPTPTTTLHINLQEQRTVRYTQLSTSLQPSSQGEKFFTTLLSARQISLP